MIFHDPLIGAIPIEAAKSGIGARNVGALLRRINYRVEALRKPMDYITRRAVARQYHIVPKRVVGSRAEYPLLSAAGPRIFRHDAGDGHGYRPYVTSRDVEAAVTDLGLADVIAGLGGLPPALPSGVSGDGEVLDPAAVEALFRQTGLTQFELAGKSRAFFQALAARKGEDGP